MPAMFMVIMITNDESNLAMGASNPLPTYPSPWGLGPHLIHNVSWALKSLRPKQDVDPFNRFGTAQLSD